MKIYQNRIMNLPEISQVESQTKEAFDVSWKR